MSNGKADRDTHTHALHIYLGWIAGVLAVLLIPHAILDVTLHWPPGLTSIHVGCTVFAGIAAVLLRCKVAIVRCQQDNERRAYRHGRDYAREVDIERLEKRLDR